MRVRESLERLVELAARRPRTVVLAVAALTLACGLLALGLRPSAGTNTFVSSSSADYQATQTDYRHFGADPVVILIREPLTDLVETRDLGTITELEACLNGQVAVASTQLGAFQPAAPGAKPPYGGWGSPCGRLMKHRPAQVVYGPGTFLNRAVSAVNTEITALENSARAAVHNAETAAYRLAIGRHLSVRQADAAASAAGQLEQQQKLQQLEQLALDAGISGPPSIDDPNFIPSVVFDQTRGVNQPKARFSYLFPTKDSALIQVRLRAGLSDAQIAQAISWIRQAVRMKMFRLSYGGTYMVSGEPVVVNDLASAISGSVAILLLGAVAVMAIVLMALFRGRLRLLPLVLALVAAAVTFGATSLAGATLTMASIAVLPILIGLAVDYSIQFQWRTREARRTGAASAELAVLRAARSGAPTIAAAALATATGFLVLLLSPVPMVRGFGVLLVVGVAVAFAGALTAGSAAIVLADRRRAALPRWGWLDASLWGAAEILHDAGAIIDDGRRAIARRLPGRRLPGRRLPGRRLPGRWPHRAGRPTVAGWLAALTRHPGRVLLVGLALALVGWVTDTQTSVQSDVTKLVPRNMAALRHLHTLERVSGVSGELDVLVHARNVATPRTVEWMIGYEDRLLAHFGYSEARGCQAATVCPALSLPDLFSTAGGATAGVGGASSAAPLTSASIQSLLAAVPTYFSQAVLTPDHRYATLAFGIRLMPLGRQSRVIDYMRSQLHPPPGVSAQVAGLPVLAADANSALSSSSRRLLTMLAALVAVALVLFAVFRSARRALVPLVPILLATGWSSLIAFAIGIPLNPMSATLGALVIAISTEFSVLLAERFGQERVTAGTDSEALVRAYRSTGAAVVASGVTAIAGFGVLLLSDITMLRDFGFVTLSDMTVSLAGVLLVLPAVLVLA
ncbi:MAG TPA: MMPL family transporter, partial [Solirubrobacteraceae bacterium]|nr:MMPL family transporter [Solirubrobacteraceae bacterium]